MFIQYVIKPFQGFPVCTPIYPELPFGAIHVKPLRGFPRPRISNACQHPDVIHALWPPPFLRGLDTRNDAAPHVKKTTIMKLPLNIAKRTLQLAH